MAGTAKRERQLARERYERQQAKRAAAVAKRRRWQQITAVVLAVVLVIGGVVGLTALLDDDQPDRAATKPSASASPSPSASEPSEPAGCTYRKSQEAASKDVGIPSYDEARAKQPFTATLTTNRGEIVVEMATAKAPCTTNSFKHLASKGFYTDTSCHRLTTANLFVLQCGDPTGSGGGGPGYGFGVENAPADGMFPAGTVAMARSQDPNSNGSQFFVVYKDTRLPTDGGGYSIFGTVTEGTDVVEKVAAKGSDNANGEGDGKPKQSVVIKSVKVGQA